MVQHQFVIKITIEVRRVRVGIAPQGTDATRPLNKSGKLAILTRQAMSFARLSPCYGWIK